uniref:Uncharacterized protein n=1 Tax=Oryzias latipes TaxID=8090 RepID=A0A3P9H1P2_ORYLA
KKKKIDFVRCNPNGDQANCVVQQTPKMPWSPELPSKLPASTAQYLYVYGESPSVGEESFGSLEGSADGATPAEIDMGSGDSGIETAERKGKLVTKDGLSFNNLLIFLSVV